MLMMKVACREMLWMDLNIHMLRLQSPIEWMKMKKWMIDVAVNL